MPPPDESSAGAPVATGGVADAGDAPTARKVATGISVGVDMSCAVTTDGSVWCWGSNENGQLGDGTRTDSDVPVRVVGIDSAVAVASGGTWESDGRGAARSAFACAVLRDGTLQCWGDIAGIVPGAELAANPIPAILPGVTDAVAVACGDRHLCALVRSGFVACAGDNQWGELGDGVTSTCSGSGCTPAAANPIGPVQVIGISGALAISGKGGLTSCAVLADGSVQCWGAFNGGTAETSGSAPTPSAVPGVVTTRSGLDVGYGHACAIAPDARTVQCWGSNYAGVLGNGAEDGAIGPLVAQGLGSPVLAVAAGAVTTCAVLGDGTVRCWGDVHAGGSLTPVAVPDLTDIVAISAGYHDVCALTQTGRVFCGVGASSEPPTSVSGF